MKILLNGESYECEGPLNVAQLVAQLQADPRTLAVERNAEIVPKSLYEQTPLAEGDRVEIVGFIGGG